MWINCQKLLQNDRRYRSKSSQILQMKVQLKARIQNFLNKSNNINKRRKSHNQGIKKIIEIKNRD